MAAKTRLNWVRKYRLCGWANLIATFQSFYYKSVISLNRIIRAVGLETGFGLGLGRVLTIIRKNSQVFT